MPLLYKLYKNKNTKSAAYGKWYAKTQHVGTVDIAKLAKIMQRNCTVKESDIRAVLVEMVETMRDQLQDSKCVKLDGLGTFKLGISTEGVEEAYDFNAGHDVKNIHVNFQPETKVELYNGKRIRRKSLFDDVKIQESPKNDVDTTKPTSDDNPGD
jgi:predicted histone-like DNA-binding protein